MFENELNCLNDIGAQLERAELAVLSCTYRQQKLRLGMIGNRRTAEQQRKAQEPSPEVQMHQQQSLPERPATPPHDTTPQRDTEELRLQRIEDERIICELESKCHYYSSQQQNRTEQIQHEERDASERLKILKKQKEKRLKQERAADLLTFYNESVLPSTNVKGFTEISDVGYHSDGSETEGTDVTTTALPPLYSTEEDTTPEVVEWTQKIDSCLANTKRIEAVILERRDLGSRLADAIHRLSVISSEEDVLREGIVKERCAELNGFCSAYREEGFRASQPTDQDLLHLETQFALVSKRLESGLVKD